MYSIYALKDPRDGSIHYVGMSKEPAKRLGMHLTFAFGKKISEKDAWIQDLAASGHVPVIETLDTAATLGEARQKERQWVQHYLTQGIALTNAFLSGKARGPRASGRKRDTSHYTSLGLMLDQLCSQKGWSYYWLEKESGTSKSSTLRASTGAVQPDRSTILKWTAALECNEETTERMLRLAGHAQKEEVIPEAPFPETVQQMEQRLYVAEQKILQLTLELERRQEIERQLRRHLGDHDNQIRQLFGETGILRHQVESLELKPQKRSSSQGKTQGRTTGPLPKHLVSLLPFAIQHNVAEQKVITHATMELPLLPARRGEWTDREGSTVTLALDTKGKAAFYQLYHDLPTFLTCKLCPHTNLR